MSILTAFIEADVRSAPYGVASLVAASFVAAARVTASRKIVTKAGTK